MFGSYSPTGGPGKVLPRVKLRRDWEKQKSETLRRSASFVEIDIAPTPEGSFLVKAAGMPSFAVGEFELRRWPVSRKRLEAALGCRVAAMTQAEWEWTLARRELVPWTPAAEAFDQANEEWLEDYCQNHLAWMEAVGADMARRRRVAGKSA